MMFVTADQIVCHLIGDYVIQSDWMANEKTKKLWMALVHAVSYSIPFWFLIDWGKCPRNICWPLMTIILTHAIIDRWRLARFVCWIKNFVRPRFESTRECDCGPNEKCGPLCGTSGAIVSVIRNHPWSECSATGYHKYRPAWLSVWLMIITDNIMHILINAAALKYLA